MLLKLHSTESASTVWKEKLVLQSSPPIFIIAVFWFLDRKIEILLILLQVPIGKISFYSAMEGNNWIKKVLVLLDCVRCFGMFLSTLEASSLSGVCPVSSFTLPGCVWRSFYREAVGFLVLGSLQAGASVRNVHLLFCLLFFLNVLRRRELSLCRIQTFVFYFLSRVNAPVTRMHS